MTDLKSYKQWSLNEEVDDLNTDKEEDDLHASALKSYKSGVDGDINLEAESENRVYAAYLERLETRLAKHQEAYEQHLAGQLPTEAFLKDIAITRRLVEDWNAYAQRLEKIVQVSGKRKD